MIIFHYFNAENQVIELCKFLDIHKFRPYTVTCVSGKGKILFMPIEEMHRQFGDYTKKMMQEVSYKKEKFIQKHLELIEKYNNEVVKGFNQIIGDSPDANYDFECKPLLIPQKVIRISSPLTSREDIQEKYQQIKFDEYVEQVNFVLSFII